MTESEPKTIVVTGCSSGIGAATARRLAETGSVVLGVDRSPPADRSVAANFYQADLGDRASIDLLVETIASEHPRIDGLCNIAGVPGTAPPDLLARVNYLGIRHLTLLMAEHMRRGGSIAHATSVAGAGWSGRAPQHLELAHTPSFDAGREWIRDHPVDHAEGYPYFKEALVVWTKVASSSFLARGVRVNCVSPGPVTTPILANFRESLGEDRVAADIDRVGRAGDPDDIASVFQFLMSDDSSWVNGADIAADGGLAASLAMSDRTP